MLGIGTRLHHRIAPAHAKRTASKLLLTPQRSQRDETPPAGLVKQAVHTSEGVLMSYRLGQGPVWLLMHGWSGSASQFYPLMRHIAAQGFTAIAYDHPAHGHSAGQTGHLPRFVRAFDELAASVADELGPIAGIIAHSMGGAVILSSRQPAMDTLPLLLISPVLDYVPQLYGMVAAPAIHPAVRCGSQGNRAGVPAPLEHGRSPGPARQPPRPRHDSAR